MNEKENHRLFYGIVMFLLIIIAVTSCSNGNNGTGADTVRDEFGQAGNNQQEITNGIDNAEQSVDKIESGVNEAGAIIADCKRILRDVRKRNEEKAETAKNAT